MHSFTFICGNACCFTIDSDYNVYGFGDNENNTLCNDHDPVKIPTKINSLTNIKSISCGFKHSIYLDYHGNVFSMGYNDNFELGCNTQTIITSPLKVNLPPIKQISSGDNFNICLSEEGVMYSFGINSQGELGIGNTNTCKSIQEIPYLNDISFVICSCNSTICNTSDGVYYSWGINNNGQLGSENTIPCYKPTQRNNWPNNIIDIQTGYYHVLLLTSDGLVYSFGCNINGELGINDKTMKLLTTPTLIDDLVNIKRISCGSKHSMCIDYNDYLWVFGNNSYGQLGLNNKNPQYSPILNPYISDIIDISTRGYNIFVKTSNGHIYGTGPNYYYQMGEELSEKIQMKPVQLFKDKEDIWHTIIRNSRVKSARK